MRDFNGCVPEANIAVSKQCKTCKGISTAIMALQIADRHWLAVDDDVTLQ